MNETMTSETGADEASGMPDEMLAEPDASQGAGAEGIEGEGGELPDGAAAARTVPLATFLGMRDEAKAMGAENAELRRIIAMMRQPDMPLGAGIPDPAADPEGYTQYMAMLEHQAAQAEQMELQQAHEQLGYVESSLDAAKAHLGESFDEAYETARAFPEVAKIILMDANPGEALVEFHHELQKLKSAAQATAGFPPHNRAHRQTAAPPQYWPGAAPYHQTTIAAPPPSLAGARGGNASALAPLVSDDPVDDILK